MKLVFCVWLGINRSNKLTHSFQVGVVRHSQSDLKEWLRIILGLKLIRMNLVMFIFFSGIHKYICLIQFINVGVVRQTWALQK